MTWQPSWKVTPKEIINEEVEERGWNAQTLASEAGWTPRLAAEVLKGRRITRLIAFGLAQAFGTSEQLFLNLQANYDAAESGGEAKPARRGRKPAKPAHVDRSAFEIGEVIAVETHKNGEVASI